MATEHQARRERTLLVEVDPSEVPTGVSFVAGHTIIVCRAEDGAIRATRNRCRHRGGGFDWSDGCVLTCPHHGWRLDVSSMTYENPRGVGPQPELEVETRPDRVRIYERPRPPAWDPEPGPARPLAPGELVVRFHAHACCELSLGDHTLFTDPWLLGPAFVRGWWLAEPPPPDALERLAQADWIYVSHAHPDHLNTPTLERLAERRPDVPVLVPEFANDLCPTLVRRCGLSDVRVLPFDRWHELAPDTRILLLRDASSRSDSGALVEYKGHRILDTVDCPHLNDGVLPGRVDLVLASYASGASGFPLCWPELYARDTIEAALARKRDESMQRAVEFIQASAPGWFVPFEDSWVEAHPADAEIRELNRKNDVAAVARLVAEACPQTRVWVPKPGAGLDLSSGEVAEPAAAAPAAEPDFERWLAPLRRSLEFAPLERPEGLLHWFRWSGYRGDLVLELVETDESFERELRRTLLDLSGPTLLAERPRGRHRYLRMRVRADVLRHVLLRGLPWEEITIGFQARLYREPDVYNFDFWDHMQNRLPATPPWPEVVGS